MNDYDVTISLERYDELLRQEMKLGIVRSLYTSVMKKAELSWNKRELSFETEDIQEFIKTIDYENYNKIVENLKNKEKKENE